MRRTTPLIGLIVLGLVVGCDRQSSESQSYLGRNPNAPTPQDFTEVETVLSKMRPYVRNIDTSGDIEAMANGDIYIALAYNGDAVQARKRAQAIQGIPKRFVCQCVGW
jgi:spermidine/putrescine-binding protein